MLSATLASLNTAKGVPPNVTFEKSAKKTPDRFAVPEIVAAFVVSYSLLSIEIPVTVISLGVISAVKLVPNTE